jgi:hypothetical protein
MATAIEAPSSVAPAAVARAVPGSIADSEAESSAATNGHGLNNKAAAVDMAGVSIELPPAEQPVHRRSTDAIGSAATPAEVQLQTPKAADQPRSPESGVAATAPASPTGGEDRGEESEGCECLPNLLHDRRLALEASVSALGSDGTQPAGGAVVDPSALDHRSQAQWQTYARATKSMAEFFRRRMFVSVLANLAINGVILAISAAERMPLNLSAVAGFAQMLLAFLCAVSGISTWMLRQCLCMRRGTTLPNERFLALYGPLLMLLVVEASAMTTFFDTVIISWTTAMTDCNAASDAARNAYLVALFRPGASATPTEQFRSSLPSSVVVNFVLVVGVRLPLYLLAVYAWTKLLFTSFRGASLRQVDQYLYDQQNVEFLPALLGAKKFFVRWDPLLPWQERIFPPPSGVGLAVSRRLHVILRHCLGRKYGREQFDPRINDTAAEDYEDARRARMAELESAVGVVDTRRTSRLQSSSPGVYAASGGGRVMHMLAELPSEPVHASDSGTPPPTTAALQSKTSIVCCCCRTSFAAFIVVQFLFILVNQITLMAYIVKFMKGLSSMKSDYINTSGAYVLGGCGS